MFRVVSYNIHKGESAARLGNVLMPMREALVSLAADLVLLQEVRGEGEAQFEFLAEEIWPHFAYGRNAVYTRGHHGNAILSKHPIAYWENEDVSQSRIERRGLLHAAIKVPRLPRPVHVVCVHLSLFESTRKMQLERLRDRVRKVVPDGAPLVVGGDFNDWRGVASAFLREELGMEEVYLQREGAHAKTFPCFLPLLPLDRIYARGLRCAMARVAEGRPWNELSDHLPLVAELE